MKTERWEVLRLPAIAEDDDPLGREPGEALWPERFPVEELEATRQALGPFLWNALYQGRPMPLDGNIFRRERFRYWRDAGDAYQLLRPDAEPLLVAEANCRRFATVDLAVSEKTTADYTVIAVWAVTKDSDLLLVDRIRERVPGPDQVPLLRRVYEQWRPSVIGIEAVAFQLAIVQAAVRDGLPVKQLTPDRDKVSRALAAATRLEAGTVYWPREASWLTEWEYELMVFPAGRHDDQVDAFSYAVLEVAEGQILVPVGPRGLRRRSRWTLA